ncbi:membrane-bound lytic murein transglycosylase D precursor [Desulfocucumis palustris]|uniref:Membrane-bound lytic murein transglycosylase D n=1 Tax=Desulfocucumis palustris TaxID=1898651 RepID=A0A2L2XG45_9FIRM|nr:membrane-bound lytic murein transglycosylase D precursor [Desulfocucumis palustris]
MVQIDLLLQMLQLQLLNPAGSLKTPERESSMGSSFALLLAAVLSASGTGGGDGLPGLTINPGGPFNYVNRYPSLMPEGTKRNVVGTSVGASAAAAATGVEEIIAKVSEKYNLDPALLKAVVKVESGFNPLAVSSAGAMGLMQLMPGTAAGLGVKDPFDPGENIDAGARYLKSMLDRYNGNVNLALAAYNAGPGAVQKYGGVPPYRETMDYLQRVAKSRREFVV